MKKIPQEKINTLKTIVMEMSQFELKCALILILSGADTDYAIDTAINPKQRERETTA